jgi:hypothetical protein
MSFRGAVDLFESDTTLPVPLSGSNDRANAGVAKTISTAKVARNFLM